MPLFRKRVLDKYLTHIHEVGSQHVALLEDWAKNLERGIYDSETQNDSVFIQRILVDVLGYVDSSDGQQWTVAKNQPVGSGNVDVALGRFSPDSAVILAPFELKGAKTDLDAIMPGRHKTPVQQAWEYAMDAKGAQWVLVSNYREIRLYAVGYGRKNYESFDLAKLTAPEQYARFILLLSAQNLLGGQTMSLLEASEQDDKDITDRFYQEYKDLRSRLIDAIGTDNSVKDKLDSIRYTQTILDRILFVAFAEDRELLPDKTLEKTYQADNPFNPQPIWKNFVGLFQAINTGKTQLNIPGYNGGLFADDPELNALNISDELCKGFKKIGEYSFDTDISVDILGHIFEQSISDLEELKAAAKGEIGEFDKKKSKRKKEGIFYTPPYITHYIVEQAVGGWLAERRREIGFDTLPELKDADYDSIMRKKQRAKGQQSGYKIVYNENIKKHVEAWEAYKTVLSTIKVLDPACGSGAFLTEVFDCLYREGQVVNKELAKLQGNYEPYLFRWDTYILANNLYGVDLNQESVEITKLSLWLKTANRKEKLTYLDDNIKVGNSLIDDPAIAGDKAFHWHKEFPQVFDNGGFDVVVGNPPYGGDSVRDENQREFLTTTIGKAPDYEIYYWFIDKSHLLLKEKGICSFIISNTILFNHFAKQYRMNLFNKWLIEEILDCTNFVIFKDATVRNIVFRFSKQGNTDQLTYCPTKEIMDFNSFASRKRETVSKNIVENNNQNWGLLFKLSQKELNIVSKIRNNGVFLKSVFPETSQGLIAYDKHRGQSEKIIKSRAYHSFEKTKECHKEWLYGEDVTRYSVKWNGREYIEYCDGVANPRNPCFFTGKRILIREITNPRIFAGITEKELYNDPSVLIVKDHKNSPLALECLLAILNSRLATYYHFNSSPKATKGVFPKILVDDINCFPIPNVTKKQQQSIITLVNKMLSLNSDLQTKRQRFLKRLADNFESIKLIVALEKFDEMNFKQFIAELKKQKIMLPPKQQDEWEEHFDTYVTECQKLITTIMTTDTAIDQMVYTLYGLTDDEIAIVEDGVKTSVPNTKHPRTSRA